MNKMPENRSEPVSGCVNLHGKIEAVVFDLDDTILHDDLSISAYTVQVFRRLQKEHIHLIAASGRAQQSMKPYVDQLGCISVYISCNGAEIWHGGTDELIYQDLLSPELSMEIADFGEKHDCYSQTYEGKYFCFNRYGKFAESYARSSRLTGRYVGDLRQYIREPRNKILMMDDEHKIAQMYQEAVKQFGGRVSVTCSKPYYLEFNPLNATKGKALALASSYLGIDVGNVIAFGDSLNDLSMFETAGFAVIVENGWESVRSSCDFVCGANNDDGPARFLEERCLTEELPL